MSAVDDLVRDNSRDELVDKADEYEISAKREDGSQKNKTELAEAIVRFETGVPVTAEVAPSDEESPDDDSDDEVDEVEALVNAPDDVAEAEGDGQDDQSDDQDDNDDEEEEEVLVKFTGRALAFQVGSKTFGRNSPFKVVDREYADFLFAHKYREQFRVATPSEAEKFYR